MATVKSIPFAVSKSQLEAVISIVKERGPILQARPIRTPSVGVLYTDPLNGERARQLFENIMRQRLERMGTCATFVLASLEEEGAVARSLQHLLRGRPTTILIASTTAPAGPDDVVGRAMLRAGCQIERFLAPVEPGNLLLLGYKDDVPIVSAPGLFPIRQTECGRFGAAADVGAISCYGLGDRLPGLGRSASLTKLLHYHGRSLRAARGCSSAGRPTSVRLFLSARHSARGSSVIQFIGSSVPPLPGSASTRTVELKNRRTLLR